ncbi:hypothetical protein [Listeria booriae]|uniref:hypothetical protein n=1 Tax=Listeria booriae TaxID=1552123 RepID=UPI001625D942|nr:hypothetical protein [Listeria booriae]MBC2196297.1 hypothetical protein [Listeria booriae]
MIAKTHSNMNGTFYWDNIEKRTLFVAKGETPDFEFEENPESLLQVETPEKDIVDNPEQTNMKPDNTTTDNTKPDDKRDNKTDDISLLSVKQLRVIAKEKNLDVPDKASKDVLIAAILADINVDDEA